MLSNKEKELLLKLLLEKAEKPMEVKASNSLNQLNRRSHRTKLYGRRIWTKEEKAQILELHNAGFTDAEIAKNYNARSHQIHMVILNYKNKLAGKKW